MSPTMGDLVEQIEIVAADFDDRFELPAYRHVI